ncbi:MAG: ABC transporter ATP-binding protein [Imperialibacter sp.]|uniref:ABC transporter ATP-binding protein n=1 Tax=Imperialibacter sp. TaxID=2038411 RepID=UPI0032EE5D0C
MIIVDNLRYTYPKNPAPTLKSISCTIQPGEIFGFLGPSGSGKSTTQKILYKLLDGYEGNVQVQGRDLTAWGKDFYEKIGVSFELPNHYLKLTALENLQFFANFYLKRPADFHELLDRVGLKEDANKPVSDFSKGMKMRLNFIRSFMHDPDILFLDEPTSGLDPVNGKVIKDMILDLKARGKTIFITTHSMYDADALCDRIALIIDGEIKALDRPATLKLQHGQRKVKVEVHDAPSPYEYALDTLGQNEEFLNILQQNNIKTIHSEEATLEDVFIKLTGQRLV